MSNLPHVPTPIDSELEADLRRNTDIYRSAEVALEDRLRAKAALQGLAEEAIIQLLETVDLLRYSVGRLTERNTHLQKSVDSATREYLSRQWKPAEVPASAKE